MVVSFLYHMALQRSIRNPLESTATVAITNYLDVGLQVATDVASSGNGASPPAASPASLAVAWQVNLTHASSPTPLPFICMCKVSRPKGVTNCSNDV